MKLSDPEVKNLFFDFINDKKRDAGFTSQVMAEKLGWEERTVNRYISNNGKDMPDTIPEKSYYDLLTVVGAKHEEFKNFFESQTEKKDTKGQLDGEDTTNVQDNRGVDNITISNNIITDSPFANKGNVTIIKSGK